MWLLTIWEPVKRSSKLKPFRCKALKYLYVYVLFNFKPIKLNFNILIFTNTYHLRLPEPGTVLSTKIKQRHMFRIFPVNAKLPSQQPVSTIPGVFICSRFMRHFTHDPTLPPPLFCCYTIHYPYPTDGGNTEPTIDS